MSRVEINAEGRHVVVDHDGELPELADTAMKLWEHAESYRPLGPAYGFASVERRGSVPVPPLGRSAHDRGRPPGQVDAQERSA
jgi:hypothetical protein